MEEYNQSFKLKIVKEYLDGNGSHSSLAKKYGISHSSVGRWVQKYRINGVDGIKSSTSDTSYTTQFKLDAIELYETTDISYNQLAEKLNIKSTSSIIDWVKKYNAKGIEGISRTRSTSNTMTKDYSRRKGKDPLEGLTEEEIREKYYQLEIEVAYLKELRSLRRKEKKNSKTNKNQ